MENVNNLLTESEGVLKRYKIFQRTSTLIEYSENKIKFQLIIFSLINRIINKLQSKNYNRFTEFDNLKYLLEKLTGIYFDRNQLDSLHDESWHPVIISEDSNKYPKIDFDKLLNKNPKFEIEYFDFGFTFFKPNKFNEEKFVKISNVLFGEVNNLSKIPSKSTKSPKVLEERDWFIVGVEFAKGNVYNLFNQKFKNRFTWEFILDSTLGKEYKDSQRQFVLNTLNYRHSKIKHSRNLFTRSKTELEIAIIMDYCKSKNFEISKEFIKHCNEYEIQL